MDRVRKIVVTAGIVAVMAGGAVAIFAQGGPGRGAGARALADLAAAASRRASRSVSST